MSRFLQEIEKGLKKETHPKADVKCFVTYVQDLPNGKGKKSNKTQAISSKKASS
jgi:hexokinase